MPLRVAAWHADFVPSPLCTEIVMALNSPHTPTSTHAAPTRSLSALDWVALVLVIIGGLNWGLIGVLNFNLVAAIFGEASMLTRLVYVLVGLSALYMIYFATRAGSRTV